MQVSVVYAQPDKALCVELEVAPGTKVAQALALACQQAPQLRTVAYAGIGIYGEQIAEDHELADGDRVELYRPLTQDPKTARRLRAKSSQR